ncbi:DUF3289 family protein [Rahnella victoriana]|uniref:DUF3289 family protein n=1 Tax=Rahnella victoriana TaxID=1510570 RepID=UPI000E6CE344|nr:DUF3289 family protein [Rahnella victoriana]UHM92321.1 DUF3289 family protein [Rahnella victoriana]
MSQISLPSLIYSTPPGKKPLDDLNYGDLTEQELKSIYGLDDVSSKVNPYNFTKKSEISFTPFTDYSAFNLPSTSIINPFDHDPALFGRMHEEMLNTLNRQQCSDILFDEMRSLSRPFAFYGIYSELIVKMINHMQMNSGMPFRNWLLNRALKDQISYSMSGSSSLDAIRLALRKWIDWESESYPQIMKYELNKSIERSKLPKFNRLKDNFNGMGITVHDTFATQITLKSLSISDNAFKAVINYKVQDHFGLDKIDISKPTFKALRFFRIWFVLQRWEKFGFRPFVTEMETDVDISGSRE